MPKPHPIEGSTSQTRVGKIIKIIQRKVQSGEMNQLQYIATEILRNTQNLPSPKRPYTTVTPVENQPYGIPAAIAKWAAETYRLDTERCTRPDCATLMKCLVPTFWSSTKQEHKYLTQIGILEPKTVEHWHKHPSQITLMASTKGDTVLWCDYPRTGTSTTRGRFSWSPQVSHEPSG